VPNRICTGQAFGRCKDCKAMKLICMTCKMCGGCHK